MRFSTAFISTLVRSSIAPASHWAAQISSSMGAEENIIHAAAQQNTETKTHAAAAVSNAEPSSNDKEKPSVDTASAAKKDTYSATTSANAKTSVKLDTSGLNSILPQRLRLIAS
ncbi:hypothetical protein N7501_002307 [Penicillium viridicatum]|nr:hypothetical protein N7501_002307 [Penicillium viridicatum]